MEGRGCLSARDGVVAHVGQLKILLRNTYFDEACVAVVIEPSVKPNQNTPSHPFSPPADRIPTQHLNRSASFQARRPSNGPFKHASMYVELVSRHHFPPSSTCPSLLEPSPSHNAGSMGTSR